MHIPRDGSPRSSPREVPRLGSPSRRDPTVSPREVPRLGSPSRRDPTVSPREVHEKSLDWVRRVAAILP
jgi:hypothetical protein